jgi:dihydrolipoamide dehydrogenase
MDVFARAMDKLQWRELIDAVRAGRCAEPIFNVDRADDREYDAIFVGGGVAGRHGSALLRSRGGRQLTVDRLPFLGGPCPHQAYGPLWRPDSERQRKSIMDTVRLLRAGR